MGEAEKSPFENLIAGPAGWPEAFHQLQQLIGARWAILFVLLAATLFVVWKSKDIVERLGWIPKLIMRLIKGLKPIAKAQAGRLTIAVAHLDNDKDREYEKLLLDELRHFEGVETINADRIVGSNGRDKKKAEEKARALPSRHGRA